MDFGKRKTSRMVFLFGIIFDVFFALLSQLSTPIHAATGINQRINFQGRLLNSAGATVPDGFYNLQFKIYQDGDGQSIGNTTGSPAGSLKWTESHLNQASHGVKVQNGYLTVQLGSVTAFGSSIDWNQDTLWLSMNIGSTNASCTPFTSCTPDGEMVPMQPMTSAVYALNSNQLGGLTASSFGQLAANQTWTGINTYRPVSDATNVFQLQKSTTGIGYITADSTNTQLVLGTASSLTGKLAFATAGGGTLTVNPTSSASSFTLTLPAETGTVCTTAATGACSVAGSGYVQLAALAVQADSTTRSSIFINKTGASGNIVQLQKNATDVFVIDNNGSIVTTGTYNTNTFNSTTLTFGGTNPVINNSTLNSNMTLQTNGTGVLSLNTTGAGTVNLGTTNSTTIGIGNSGSTNTITGATTVTGTTGINSSGTAATTIGTGVSGTGTILIQGGASSAFSVVNATGKTVLNFVAPSTAGTVTYQLPAGGTGGNTYGICTTFVVCSGYAASGGANTALSNLASVAINTSLLPGVANSISVGSSGLPFASAYFGTDIQAPLLRTFDETSASTNSGVITVRSGNTSGATSNTGAVTIRSGNAATGNSGAVTVDSGTAGGGTKGAVNIGTANSNSVNIGNTVAATQIAIQSGSSGSIAMTGNVTVTGTYNTNTFSSTALTFGGANPVISSGTTNTGMTVQSNGTGTLTLNSTGAGTVNVGAANSTTINVGNTTAATQTLIQGGTGGSALSLQAGTNGSISIGTANDSSVSIGSATNTNALTFGQSTAGETINIANVGTAAATTVNILSGAGTAGVATLNMGNNARITSISIGNVNPAAARTISIGNSTGTGNSAVDTINIATNPTTVAGGNTVNIATGTPTGSGTNLVTIGSTANASTTIIRGGTGSNAIQVTQATGAGVIVGNANTGSTVSVQCGAGTSSDCGFANNGNDHSTFIGSTTGASATTIQSGSSGLTLSGNITASGTYNTNTFTSTALTFAGASPVISSSSSNSGMTLQSNGGGTLTLNSTGAGTVNLGTTNTTTIGVGNTSAATETTIQGGTGVNAVGVQVGGGGAISIGTTNTNSITMGSGSGTAGTILIQGGVSSSFSVTNTSGRSILAFAAPSTAGIVTYQLPAGGVGGTTYGICTTLVVCSGYAAPGANTALSNLASVAINTSLLPGTTNTINVGSGALTFANGFFGTGVQSPQVNSADQTAGSTPSVAFTLRSGDTTGSSSSTGAVTLRSGNATSGNSGAITIDSGTASGTKGAISLGAANTNSLTIGNTAATTQTLIQGGTGGSALSIQSGASGAISIGTTNNSPVSIGSVTNTNSLTFGQSTDGETINISNAATTAATTVNILSGSGSAGVATLNMGNNARITGISIGNVNPAAARTIRIGNTTGTGNGVIDTINIATNPTTVAGGNTVNIASGTPTGSGTNLVTIGSTANASTTVIQGGSGNGIQLTQATGANIVVGNPNTGSTVSIQCGAGTSSSCGFANNGNDHSTFIGSTTGASATTIQSGSNGLTLTGNITASGTYNTNTFTSTALTFAGSNPVISASTTNTGVAVQANGTGTLTLNTGGAGTVSLGASNSTTINVGNTTAATQTLIQGGTGASALSLQVGANGVISVGTTVQTTTLNIGNASAATVTNITGGTGISALNAQVGNGGSINIGTTAQTSVQNIGNTSASTLTLINGGTSAQAIQVIQGAGGTVTIGGTGAASTVSVQCGAGTSTSCGFGNNATDHTTTIGSVTGTSLTTLQAGSGGISLAQDTTLAAGESFTFASGAGRFLQTFTGTTTDAHVITANSLTTGTVFETNSTNNTAANTAWSGVVFNSTSAQGTTAVSTGSIYGADFQFNQTATIANNNESAVNIAIASNTGSPTDNLVNSILNIANNDTATGNLIAATDGIRITAGTANNIVNGISLNGTFQTNLIATSTGNYTVTAAGAVTQAGNLTLSGATPVISSSTTNAGLSLQANGTGTVVLNTTGAGTVNVGTANTTTVGIGNITAATQTTISGGTGASAVQMLQGAGGIITIGGTGAASYVSIQCGAGTATTCGFGNNATDHTTTFGSVTGTSLTTLQSGSGGISLANNTTLAATRTLTVTSGSTSLTSNTTGDALTVSNSTSTGNIAVFRDNATTVFSIADTGQTLFKPSTNTATAFQIQPAGSSTPTLNADTLNGRIGINTAAPNSTLEINSTVAGTSGLRFTQLNSASTGGTSFTGILGLDTSGNIGLSQASVSLTSPALAYWDGANNPTTGAQSYPLATLSGVAAYDGAANGVRLTSAGTNQSGSVNWNFSQVPFEEIQFKYKSGGGTGADGVWFYSYANATPTTEFGTGMTSGYIIYISEFHNCIGVTYGGYTDGNQCGTGGGANPLGSVAMPDGVIDDNNFHDVDIQIRFNVIIVRIDNVPVLTVTDVYTRDTSALNFGFGARTGGSTNAHYIKGLLVTKLGTNTSQYNINNVSPLASDLYWDRVNGRLGVGTTTPTDDLEVDGTASFRTAEYSTGKACQGSSAACTATGTTVYGTGTTWTSAMVGNTIVFADGTTDRVTAFISATQLTVSTTRIKAASTYKLLRTALAIGANDVQVGSANTDATAVSLTLDSYNNSTDPTGTNGEMYYNTARNAFRCYQNSAWTDCAGVWRTIFKTADEGRTSATPTSDATLQFAMAANVNYSIRCQFYWAASGTGGFRTQYTGPSTPTSVNLAHYGINGVTGVATMGGIGVNISGTATAATLTSTAASGGYMTYNGEWDNGANAGTWAFQWGLNTAVGTTTLRQGSYCDYASF